MAAVKALLDVNDRVSRLIMSLCVRQKTEWHITQVSQTEWNNYPYTAILVLGAGPEEPNVSISPEGSFVLPNAAMMYRQHQAPFIIVSEEEYIHIILLTMRL